MNKRKVLQTFIFVFLLVVTLVSWGTYRVALATDNSGVSEVTTTKIEDLETSAEECTTEKSVEEVTTTESVAENTSEDVASPSIESSETISTEVIEISENTESTIESEEKTENREVSIELITEESIPKEKLVEHEESIDGKAGQIYVNNWGTYKWDGSHWVWMTNDKVIWCLDNGMSMTRRNYNVTEQHGAYGSNSRAVRINSAILYYYKMAGGLNKLNVTAYGNTQKSIWGWSDNGGVVDSIASYASHAYRLKYGSSTLGDLKRVSKDDANKGGGSLKTQKITKSTWSYTPSDASWKYFAASSGWNTKGSGKYGYIKKFKIVKEGFTGTVSASVNKNGEIKVTTKKDGKDYVLKNGESVKIYFKVGGDFFGSKNDVYYQTGSGIQNMVYGYEGTEAYFGVKLVGDSTFSSFYPSIQVNKQTNRGKRADATFGIKYSTWGNAIPALTQYDLGVEFNAGELLELEDIIRFTTTKSSIEGTGHYYVYEKDTEDGLAISAPVIHFMIATKTGSDGNTYYYIYNSNTNGINSIVTPLVATGTYSDKNLTNCAKTVTATVLNNYQYGKDSFKKLGHMLVGYEKAANGNIIFKYTDAPTTEATFKLYAAENIILPGGETLWTTNQEISSGTQWSTQAGCVVNYNSIPKVDGTVEVTGLPIGSYYFKEVSTGEHYLLNEARCDFEIKRNPDKSQTVGLATAMDDVINLPLNASITVVKEDIENEEKLAGAEFTLYAKSTNKDFSGKQLFPDSLAEKAVVSRNNKEGSQQTEIGWIRIQTVVSGEDGSATFDDIPYGDYLVVETKAPDGYSLPEESWKFTHTKENGASSKIYVNSLDYSHTFTFGNEQKYNVITTYKHGQTVTGTTDENSNYGSYKKLVIEDKPMSGVTFAVYDETNAVVDTFITDEHGLGKSANLPKGTYSVKEISCDVLHKVSPEIKTVKFSGEDTAKTVEFSELEFEDELINTQLLMYKNGEVPYITNEVLENTDQYTSVVVTDESSAYTFNTEPLAGALFGVYATQDFRNDEGTVIIRTDDCVGYAVTNEEGVAVLNELVLPGNYKFKEVTAPEGYRLSDSELTFTVKAAGMDVNMQVNSVNPILNTHTKSALKLTKQDGKTKEPLTGVEFGVYNSDDVLIGTYTTDENGEIYIGDVPLGVYYFEETKPLDGYYAYTDEIKFEVTEDGMEYSIIVYNDKIPDKPKLGTFGFVDVFCGIWLVLCSAVIVSIWVPSKKR